MLKLKKVRNIILIALGVIVSLNILVVVLLNIPFIQQKALRMTVSWLQEKINSEISIGHIRLDLLRGVSLDNVFLADQRGDTLLYISSLSAGTSLFHVYQNNTLRIDDVRLVDFKAYLSKDSADAPFNFQFLIDAFSSKDTAQKKPSLFDLVIHNIELRNGTFRYDILSQEETPEQFNASRIHVQHLNGRLSLGSIQPDRFAAKVYRLSGKEQSGLNLENLRVQIHKDKEFIRLVGFLLDLPNSRLKLSDVWFDYQYVTLGDSPYMKNGIYYIQIEKSEIVPEDLRAFYPPLAGLSKPLKLEGILNGSIPSLGIKTLNVSYNDEIALSLSNSSMSDWGNYRECNYVADISRLFVSQNGVRTILQISSPETKLPDIVNKFGNLQSRVRLSGKLERLQVNGDFSTAPGTISINGNIGYNIENGKFSADAAVLSHSFLLNTILDPSLQTGKSAFDLHTTVNISAGKEPDIQVIGTIPLFTFRNYAYQKIGIEGAYRGINNMEAQVRLDDENIFLDLEGRVTLSENNVPEYRLLGSIRHFSPYNLHLTSDFKENVVGADIRVKVRGDKPENMLGSARLNNLSVVLNDSVTINADSLLLKVDRTANGENLLKLISPYLNARIEGVYNPATLAQTAQNILHDYLPTFFNYTKLPPNATPNNFSYSVTLKNVEPFLNLFRSPVTFNRQSKIWGEFREQSGAISLHAEFPELFYGKLPLDETVVCLRKRENAYAVDVRSTIAMKTPICAEIITEVANDTVSVVLKYDNSPADFSFSGEIQSLLSFQRKIPGKDLILTANFLPSDLTVNDLHVGFKPAMVTVKPGKITVNNFGLTYENQPFFGINGVASASTTDTLQVFFKRASIATLLGGFDISDIPVNGYLDGTICFTRLLEKPRFYTKAFRVDDITYKKDSIGSLVLNSRWHERRQGMNVGFSLIRSNNEIVTADGFVSPIQDLMNFNVNLHLLPIEIAQPFLEGILHNLNGYCGADLKVEGKLFAPDVRGYIFLQNASATVDYTNVTYHLSDTIRFTPTTIDVKNMMIYDNKNHSARLNCAVKHDRFSNFTYSGSLQLNNLLVLNNPNKIDSLFYGTFYANGNLTVRGNMREATVGGNLRNGNNSNLRIRLPESAAQANTYRSIVFLNSESENPEAGRSPRRNSFSVKAKVAVELTREAEFGLLINSATGDELFVRGDGNITADYDSNMSGIRLFGQYTVDNGHLRMRLSQFPPKLFTIQQGSRVNLNGDPMMSSFDITASYRVRADLNTLDASFATLGLVQTRVPVECILHIQGSLNKLNLTYEITLPDANDDVNRMVSSLINTDDMRIKQFAYLVAFGSFFPPNSQFSTGNNNVMTSLAASSLTSVLNNSLSGILGKNWTLGTDLATQGDFSDLEMNVFLSTQLFNDRLTFNTNVGYRNANMASESPWIGDFDLEYKLTKSGSVRAKAYSHTNNEIFRSSNTIQGVGMVFSREGKRFRDLFRFRRKRDTEMLPVNNQERFFRRNSLSPNPSPQERGD